MKKTKLPELPPELDRFMGDTRNTHRARWAERCIVLFRHDTGTDKEDAIADLVADLMHLARQWGQDPEAELVRAREHFRTEEWEEKEGLS